MASKTLALKFARASFTYDVPTDTRTALVTMESDERHGRPGSGIPEVSITLAVPANKEPSLRNNPITVHLVGLPDEELPAYSTAVESPAPAPAPVPPPPPPEAPVPPVAPAAPTPPAESSATTILSGGGGDFGGGGATGSFDSGSSSTSDQS
jgi:hypothetical protein